MQKIVTFILSATAIMASCGFLLIVTMAGEQATTPLVSSHTKQMATSQVTKQGQLEFRVLSLNLAHGRRDSRHQVTLTTPQILANIDEITTLLKREEPDLVALQEADDPSLWSGRFNHVAYLANSGYAQSVHGINVDGMGLSYGTAVLSKAKLTDPQSITFKPSPPTLTKGFTIATVQVSEQLGADLVSVHLDFFSKRVRKRQVKKMVEILASRNKPLIIMGDFNDEWQDGTAPQVLSKALGLTTYKPTTDQQVTFPALQKRIDFILISKEFDFIDYTVLADVVSDHRAILATLKVRNQ